MSGENRITAGAEQGRSTLVHSGPPQTTERLHEVRADNPDRLFASYDAVRHDTQRRILHALAHNNGRVSYEQLDETLHVVDRTRRKHVSELADAGLVERIDANFTFVEFADTDAEVLCREALARWFDSTA